MSTIVSLHAADVASPASPGSLPRRTHFPDALPAARPPAGTPDQFATGGVMDADVVVHRLEEAGTTLLCLPHTGHSTRLRTSKFEVLAAALDGSAWTAPEPARAEAGRLRPLPPDGLRIDRMDEAFGWLSLIPRDRYVLRRIVGARALVSPSTERHLFSWRRLGTALGADHKAVQRWHGQGIGLIVAGLRAGGCLPGSCHPGQAR